METPAKKSKRSTTLATKSGSTWWAWRRRGASWRRRRAASGRRSRTRTRRAYSCARSTTSRSGSTTSIEVQLLSDDHGVYCRSKPPTAAVGAQTLSLVKMKAFSKRYNLTNNSLYSKSHCACDDMLFSCLKATNTSAAQFMGNIYFNLVQVPCVEDTLNGKVFKDAKKGF